MSSVHSRWQFLVWTLAIESTLVALSAILMEVDASLARKLSTVGVALIAGSVLTVVFVGVPSLIPSRRPWGLFRRMGLGLGVTLLAIAIWTAFVVPAVWEAWDECLPPGGLFDGRCEVGPL